MHRRHLQLAIHTLLAGSLLVGLAACGSDAAARSATSPVTPAPATTAAPTTVAPVTLAPTTVPVTVAVTLPPTTAPATTVAETTVLTTEPAATEPAATEPPTTVAETTMPVETAPPVLAVTDDPCLLASQLEIAVTFGGDVQDARPSTDATGAQRSCEWRLDADESSRATITVTRGVVTDASTGWPAAPVTVDGLGEVSFSYLDNDLHLGFVRAGLTVTLVVTDNPASTVPDWVALAKIMDRRITGEESLPV